MVRVDLTESVHINFDFEIKFCFQKILPNLLPQRSLATFEPSAELSNAYYHTSTHLRNSYFNFQCESFQTKTARGEVVVVKNLMQISAHAKSNLIYIFTR
jgi:hypothetical protein